VGTYNPLLTEVGREHDMSVMNGVETMKSAAFASTTIRPTVMAPNFSPGPAAYPAPSLDTQFPRVTFAVSKTGRDGRYTGDNFDGRGDDSTT